MTSAERYFRAFVHIMPKRMKIISELHKEKQKLDEKIIAGDTSQETLSEWKHIVGEDFAFRSAEKRERQSLRHYIYKTIRSLVALAKFDAMTAEAMQDPEYVELIKKDPRRKRVYLSLLDLLERRALYAEALKKLDESLITQNNYLGDSQAFAAQHEIQKEIKDSMKGLLGDIAALQRNLRGVLERTIKIGKTDILVGLAIVCLILAALSAASFGWEQPPNFFEQLVAVIAAFLTISIGSTVFVGAPYLAIKISAAIVRTIRTSI